MPLSGSGCNSLHVLLIGHIAAYSAGSAAVRGNFRSCCLSVLQSARYHHYLAASSGKHLGNSLANTLARPSDDYGPVLY